jgi:hypothetical protein
MIAQRSRARTPLPQRAHQHTPFLSKVSIIYAPFSELLLSREIIPLRFFTAARKS